MVGAVALEKEREKASSAIVCNEEGRYRFSRATQEEKALRPISVQPSFMRMSVREIAEAKALSHREVQAVTVTEVRLSGRKALLLPSLSNNFIKAQPLSLDVPTKGKVSEVIFL